MYWLPNIITVARLIAVPIIVGFILVGDYVAAFWAFVLAGLSDALDGYLANRLKAVTEIGGYLDPLADKVLLVGTYLTLGFLGHIPGWLVAFVVLRDVLILSGSGLLLMITGSLRVEPSLVGKINTCAQILLIGFVLASSGFDFDVTVWHADQVMIYLVAFTTAASGAGYIYLWGRRLVMLQRRA